MRRISTILLLGGSAALVWCLTVLGGAALYQWYAGARIDRQAALVHTVSAVPPKMHDVIGRLEIPRLNVSTVVIEGDDNHSLRLGAGHVPGTALPGADGNVGIAAHRDTFFRPLRNIAADDRITLKTAHGEYHYIVDSTQIVRPDDVAVLRATSRPELTLVTCYPFYYVGSAPLRFVVHARQTG